MLGGRTRTSDQAIGARDPARGEGWRACSAGVRRAAAQSGKDAPAVAERRRRLEDALKGLEA